MRTQGLTRAFLMEESEAVIAGLAREGSTPQGLVARRMLDEPHLYRVWEAEHDRLMRGVAETRSRGQLAALRSVCFGLIHRKAMFEYLRVQKITGRARHAVFELVYGDQDYVKAVLVEHGNYLRSVSSLACSHHLGLARLEDEAFGHPMNGYELCYADYFRTFCNSALTSNRSSGDDTLSTLLPYLKRQLGIMRQAIVTMPRRFGNLERLEWRTPAANVRRLTAPLHVGSSAA